MTSISQTDSVFYFSINAPYKQCEVLYIPSMPDVVMVSESGLSVQVPTNRLRQFVTSDGIKGRFRMIIDANKKIAEDYFRVNLGKIRIFQLFQLVGIWRDFL